MNKFKAVFFDCDGTLVDSEQAHYASWKKAIQKQGGDLPLEEYFHYAGKSTATISTLLAKKMGFDCAQEIYHDKCSYFHQQLIQGLPPIQPTVDFLHLLHKKRKDLKLGLASAAEKKEIELHLKNLKILPFFDVIVSGRDDLHERGNKPEPHIYLHAAKMVQLLPSQCIAIEDSATGIAAAASAGCIAVAVPNQFSSRQDFSRAHLKLDTLKGVSVEQFFDLISQS